jgi:hypothetical protein
LVAFSLLDRLAKEFLHALQLRLLRFQRSTLSPHPLIET